MPKDSPLLALDSQLCFALYTASRTMTATYEPLLASLGITYPQYLVLLCLWEKDGARVSDLGERLALDSGTLTPLLRRMESHGLVARKRSEEDERVVEVFLTARGKHLKKDARKLPQHMFRCAGLSLDEIARLRGSLHRLTEHLRERQSEKELPS